MLSKLEKYIFWWFSTDSMEPRQADMFPSLSTASAEILTIKARGRLSMVYHFDLLLNRSRTARSITPALSTK